ncbi:MAG: DUF6265 family protein [Pseudomonadota bacterium]
MKRLAAVIAVAGLVGCTALPAGSGAGEGTGGGEDDRLDWLLGCWTTGGGGSSETWLQAGGGVWTGEGRTVRDGVLAASETMQVILREGEEAFVAEPEGQARVVFDLVALEARGFLAENPAHDYPQRIGYRIEGDALIAEISLIDGTDRRAWTYRPCD